MDRDEVGRMSLAEKAHGGRPSVKGKTGAMFNRMFRVWFQSPRKFSAKVGCRT